MDYKKVVAFDIGIKNLAFCILENDSTVLSLENCTLLEPIQTNSCSSCKLKASFQIHQQLFCKKHIPKTHKTLPELSKKKLPSNKLLKELVKVNNCENLGVTNDKCIESLSRKFAIHYEQPKQQNASKMSLEDIHDGLREFVRNKWDIFSGSTHILLENQPVFKNPHMKSVQVLLFATLREMFLEHQQTPQYHFVHAKKKVGDAPKGDAGYNERKQKSEERLISLFDQKQVQGDSFYEMWKQSKKKSDMADALCMAVDYSST
jgi:hypothetical protein